MIDYPKRESFWAHKFVRVLIRTCAVNDIGPYGFMLVTIIAHTEDAKQYTDAPGYWNDQLVSQMACGSVETLNRARQKAVNAGWLHYIPGGKGRIGKYWTMVPDKFQSIAPSAVDEDAHICLRTGAEEASRIGGWKQEDKRGGNERTIAEHSPLSPSLNPSLTPFWLRLGKNQDQDRQDYFSVKAREPKADQIGEALTHRLGRKVWANELVEEVLRVAISEKLAAAPKARLADAVMRAYELIDAHGWEVVRKVANFTCEIPDEATLRDALACNIPVCNAVINAMREVA